MSVLVTVSLCRLAHGMAFDPALAGVVLRAFVAVVSRWLRRRARAHGIRGTLKTGGVTVIQCFGSALNLNVHFHTLMIDGVYGSPRVARRCSTRCPHRPTRTWPRWPFVCGDDYTRGGWWDGGVKRAVDEFWRARGLQPAQIRNQQFILRR